jgi:hypothetical protein
MNTTQADRDARRNRAADRIAKRAPVEGATMEVSCRWLIALLDDADTCQAAEEALVAMHSVATDEAVRANTAAAQLADYKRRHGALREGLERMPVVNCRNSSAIYDTRDYVRRGRIQRLLDADKGE